MTGIEELGSQMTGDDKRNKRRRPMASYLYNIELDEPTKDGWKFINLTFSEKLEKGKHYTGNNPTMGRFGFTVCREVKPTDFTEEDIVKMYVRLEDSENYDVQRIKKKFRKTFITGKMVSVTKQDAYDFLEYAAYDDDIFNRNSDDEKEICRKLDKKFKLGWFDS